MLYKSFIVFVKIIVDLYKEIVNGVHTPNGVNAASLVMEGPKTEPESCSKVLSMGEWTVLDKQPNSETVTCMDAQVCIWHIEYILSQTYDIVLLIISLFEL